jgi:hypothetical protein
MADLHQTAWAKRPGFTGSMTAAGNPLDITGAASVEFVIQRGGLIVETVPVTVLNAAKGRVRVAQMPALPEGHYTGLFVITWTVSPLVTQEVPDYRAFTIQVQPGSAQSDPYASP